MEKISQKKFYYYLEVLPPLLMGKAEVVCFLKEYDKNEELVKKIESKKFNDLFIQGEGWDMHQVYGVTKDGQTNYYYIGETKQRWNTEDFRYPDTGNNMYEKIEAKLAEVS